MLRARGARLALLLTGFLVLAALSVGAGLVVHAQTKWLAVKAPAESLAEWVHLIFLMLYFMLVAMPVLGFGGSEFYDITKLFHFPVSHRIVLVAQVIGLMFGGTSLFFMPALAGLVVGLPGGPGIAILRIVVVLLFLFHAVALSQVLQLAFLHVLRSRRFRELAAVLSALVMGAIYLTFRFTLNSPNVNARILELLSRGTSDYLAPVPSYWVSSLVAPGAGLSRVLVFGLVLMPLTALLLFLAAALQERAFHGEMPSTRVRKPARFRIRSGRTFFLFRAVPEVERAVVGHELRLLRREPFIRTMLIQQSVFFLVPVFFAISTTGGGLGSGVRFAAQWGVWALLFVETTLILNVLGLEGTGITALLTTPVSRARILLGKALAYFLLCGVVNLLFLVAVHVLIVGMGGEFAGGAFGARVLQSVAALIVLLGIGLVVSVLSPARMSARGRGALAQKQAGREGCLKGIVRLIGLAVLFVLQIPVWFLGLSPAWSPLGLVYAGLLFSGALWLSARLLSGRVESVTRALARSAE